MSRITLNIKKQSMNINPDPAGDAKHLIPTHRNSVSQSSDGTQWRSVSSRSSGESILQRLRQLNFHSVDPKIAKPPSSRPPLRESFSLRPTTSNHGHRTDSRLSPILSINSDPGDWDIQASQRTSDSSERV